MSIENILVIDESESNILFFELIIQNLEKNLTVYTASTGSQAEIIVRSENIGFVICAWEMDPMPGTILIQKLRENRSRYLPCLIFSKRISEEEAVLMRDMGLHDVLGIPFDKANAEKVISSMIDAENCISPIEKKLRRIEALLYEHKFTEALKFVDNSLTKKGPHLAKALTLLGEIWLGTRNLDKAENCIDRAIEEDPDNVQAHRLKAKFYSLNGDHEKAIAMLEKMAQKSPLNMVSMVSLGSAYIEADQHEKAQDILAKVEDMDATFQPVKDQQGKIAFKEGNVGLAAQLLSETQHGDELASNFNNIAIAKVANGDFEEGIETYNSAISLLADKAKLHQLYYNLGLAFRKKGELGIAFEKLCLSYLEDPTFEKAYSSLAKLNKEMKENGAESEIKVDLVRRVKDARTKIKDQDEPKEPTLNKKAS